jgi:hypothetical protein
VKCSFGRVFGLGMGGLGMGDFGMKEFHWC